MKSPIHIDLLLLLVKRELGIRYRKSFLGLVWTLLNPLIFSLMLWFVFVNIFRSSLQDGTQYAPYVLSGILIFNFFNQGILQASDSISMNSGILKKMKIKPYLFCMATSVSNLVNFVFGLVSLYLVHIISGGVYVFPIVNLILIAFFMVLLTSGMGMLFAPVIVQFDDFRNILTLALQFTTYLAPIFYPKDILSEHVKFVVSMNPVTSYLDIFRSSFLQIGISTRNDWLLMSIFSLTIFSVGYFSLRKFWPKIVVMM